MLKPNLKIKIPISEKTEPPPSPPPFPPPSPSSPSSASSSSSSSSGSSSSSSYASSSSSASTDDEQQAPNNNREEESGREESGGGINGSNRPAPAQLTHAAPHNNTNNYFESEERNDASNANNKKKQRIIIVRRQRRRDREGALFKRIWSLQDEIAILKGMAEYQPANGPVPMSATGIGDFHATIAGSLSIAVNNSQLVDKVRRLRKRYRFAGTRGKNGEAPKFSKPHDELVYELSRSVWGPDGSWGGAEEEREAEARGGGVRKRLRVLRRHCPNLMEAVEGTGNMAAEEAAGAMEPMRARGLEEKLRRRKVEGMKHHLVKMELLRETVKLIMEGIDRSST